MEAKMTDAQAIKAMFKYDAVTGNIYWVAVGKGKIKKKPAGTVTSTGYVGILIEGKRYLAHRIAWALAYGSWPEQQIDHINGIKTDNRIENLRLATNAQNGKNYGANKTNTSGIKGVSWCKQTQKWRAMIKVNGKSICKGRYIDKQDALMARHAAEIEYFGEWRRLCR
jgi:hypothetical protein